ncbi:GTP-binding protein [Bosea sp. (in: a-proteobacteria)]|uniref:CobW family GTP-binding protein n=1 Tax=Bosea sp. (in: a-proteobacteria) TaxID=1871050 RepID=UPI001AC77514|nr:GTP-binding protein [Bosea sp. (in: a-proteobacteria)]MBN9436582.1 GTP-binding protein [Bosea sp. (in: a-proteobacteria)]
MNDRLALTLVTGFLGSGKTTLIRRFVETDRGADTGIIVNEFGEAGVDHTLFVHAVEQIELVDGGCLCCARRADVAQAMYRLVQAARGGRRFSRAILETSGLADPAPIIATLANDPWLRSNVRLASVVTVVDAVAGLRNLETQPEARRQVSIADTVVVTKRDMRDARSFEEIAKAVSAIAPDLRLIDAQETDFDAEAVLGGHGSPDTPSRSRFHALEAVSHRDELTSFTLEFTERIDWPAFTVWLSSLLHAHGDRILRVKGLLNTTSAHTRLAIHGVQHVMHPPTHLPLDPEDSRSFLVFITRGVEYSAVEQSLQRMLVWAERFRKPSLRTSLPPAV